MEDLKVVYIIFVGVDTDGKNIYQFLVSQDSEDTFSEGWEEQPAGIIRNETLMIDESQYEYVKELKTDITLKLAQDNYCFSLQDMRDSIVAMAYEDISEYEEYPEPCRIVIHFGDSLADVEKMLAKRDMSMKYVK